MPDAANDNEYLTPLDVEQLYKIKEGTQKSLRSRRQIPFIRLGNKLIRYRRSDIEAWLAASAVPVNGAAR